MLWQSATFILLAAVVGLMVNQVRYDGLALVGTMSSEMEFTTEQGAIKGISLEEAQQHFFSKTAFFLDARSFGVYEKGHLKGARNIPVEATDQLLFETTADIPQDATIITYCDGKNCMQGEELATILANMGFQDVRVLSNGYTLWLKHNLPVETGSSPNNS